MKTFWLFFACALVWGANTVDTPSVGFALSADGSLLRVSGIAGAFITTATEHSDALSCGFSKQLGFVKLPSAVRVLNGDGELVSESEAPAGAALFGFNKDGDAGVAYYPDGSYLAALISGEWRRVPFSLGVPVLAVRLEDSGHLSAVIARGQLTLASIRISDGAIEAESDPGGVRGPVLLPSTGGLLFVGEQGVIYRDVDGVDHVVTDSTDVTAMQQMGPDWAQLVTRPGRNLAVRLAPVVRVLDIPEVAQ